VRSARMTDGTEMRFLNAPLINMEKYVILLLTTPLPASMFKKPPAVAVWRSFLSVRRPPQKTVQTIRLR